MAARRKLTDKKRKQIIARYIECNNYCQTAREFGVSETTVRKLVKNSPESVKKFEQKKEENTLDMLKYMESQKGNAQNLLTNMILAMSDPAKLKKANVRDLATAFGIIFDKFTQASPRATDELLNRAREILGGINGAIK